MIESSVVSSVVVRIAHTDVEHDSPEQFSQGLLWSGEAPTDHFRKAMVSGISGCHFVKAE
jgi:hypothetical protein